MKRMFLLIALFSFFSTVHARQVIDNPAQPLSSQSGRVVTLKEVLRITDEGDAFYFQRPNRLHIGPDGAIFVADTDQLLWFGPDGKFIRNFFKKGQGPGELSYVNDFAVSDHDLIVHNGNPSKIVRLGFDGRLLKDFSVRTSGGSLQLLGVHGETYAFIKTPFPMMNAISGMEAVAEQKNALLSVVEGVEGFKESVSFPTQVFVKKSKGGGGAIIPLNKIIAVPYLETKALISHTPEYAVKIVDVERGEVLRSIRRKYERIKTSAEDKKGIRGGAMIDGKVVVAPAPEFAPDIVNLFIHDKDIWVATSTKSKDKGVLIDVFDSDGVYRDSFYLALPEPSDWNIARPAPQVVQGDYLYAIEKDAEESYMIKKYMIGR